MIRQQDGHCHIVGCTIRDTGAGAGVRDCGSIVIAASKFIDNIGGALYAELWGDTEFYEKLHEPDGERGQGEEVLEDESGDENDVQTKRGISDDFVIKGRERRRGLHDAGKKEKRGVVLRGSSMIILGSWTNTQTWFHYGRPRSINNYLFEVCHMALDQQLSL